MLDYKKLSKNIGYGLLVGTCITITTAAIIGGTYINKNILNLKSINKTELDQTSNSEIYADDGKTLIWTDSTYQHKNLTLDQTPDVLLNLLISTEDKTFYTNNGFSDIIRLTNAVLSNRGGSTITQQLVKNIRYNHTKLSKYDRKIQEMALAFRLTHDFSKNDILIAYLNKVGFLENSYGFNTAMYLLYGEEITKDKITPDYLAKYATIVGMLKNPSIYNPRTNPEETQNRRNQVLKNAYDNHAISKKEYKAAIATSVTDGLKNQGWFTQQVYETASENGAYVHSILKQLEQYGYNIKNKEHPIKVISNLNIEQNKWLQNEVSNPDHYINERQQIAVTVVEPNSGKVLAQVGSRNGTSPYDLNRATQVTRSSGSTIKPFLSYAPLIEFSNITENSTWNANTTTYAGTNVTVYNYGRYMYGQVNTTTALKLSLNVPAVNALAMQEPWMNQTIMSNLGLSDHKIDADGNIQTVMSFAGSQALGINDSSADFASAFATLANNGQATTNMYIKSITQDGETVELDNHKHAAMSPRTASKLLSMLETTTQADGSAHTTAIPEYQGYAVKTGTVGFDENQPIYQDATHQTYLGTIGQLTSELVASDQWMSGTTKNVAVSIWTGFDDQAIYGDWITPENQARSTIFVNTMKHFNQNKDTSQFNFDQTKIELTKKEEIQSLSIENPIKSNLLTKTGTIFPSLIKNDILASQAQIDLRNQLNTNSLSEPYQNIKPYYDENNALGYALYQLQKPDDTVFYTINSDGELVSESN